MSSIEEPVEEDYIEEKLHKFQSKMQNSIMRSQLQKQQTAVKAKSFQEGVHFHKEERMQESNMTPAQQKQWEKYLVKRKKYEDKKRQEINDKQFELQEEHQKRLEKLNLVD